MTRTRNPLPVYIGILAQSVFVAMGGGCGFVPLPGPAASENPAGLSSVEGIDPQQPNIERSTRAIDFTGVKTIRVELHTARLVIEQSEPDDANEATLKVVEIITAGWLGKDTLENHLYATEVRAERSFVDNARLNVTAAIAEGLQPQDIAFDIKLTIPRGAGTEIYLSKGPVEIINLAANVEIATTDGAIFVSDIGGNVVARTTNGAVEVRNAPGNIEAVTSNADVSVRAQPMPGSRISAITSKANAQVFVRPAFAASLNLVATPGTVSANLDGFSVSNISTAAGLLTAQLNGGGGKVEVFVDEGDIEFSGISQP